MSVYLLASPAQHDPVLDAVRELAETGAPSFHTGEIGDAPVALRNAEVVLLAGWDAIGESVQVRTHENVVVAVILEWPWVERGFGVTSRAYPSPAEAESLLDGVDAVVAIDPGVASALHKILGIDALHWPVAPAPPAQSAQQDSLVVAPSFSSPEECAHLVGWLSATAKRLAPSEIRVRLVQYTGTSFGPQSDEMLHSDGVVFESDLPDGVSALGLLAPQRLADRRALLGVEASGLHPTIAWMTRTPSMVDPRSGAQIEFEDAGTHVATLNTLIGQASARRVVAETAWRQLGASPKTWTSAEREVSQDPGGTTLLSVTSRAVADPTNIGHRLVLADQLFQCGFDRAAHHNIRTALNLAAVGVPKAEVPTSVVRNLAERRISIGESVIADLDAAIKAARPTDPAPREASTTSPFETDGILGVRYYPWAPELRVARRSMTVMVPERHAGIPWWMVEGRFVSDEKSIAGFEASSDGEPLPRAGDVDDGRWSVLVGAPATGPFPRPIEIELDVVTAAGRSVSEGVAVVDAVRGLSAHELGTNIQGGALLAPLLPGAAAESNGIFADGAGWWTGASFSLTAPLPLAPHDIAVASFAFDTNDGAQFDWLELSAGGESVKAFRVDSRDGVAQFDANVSGLVASNSKDDFWRIDVVGHCGSLPPEASSAPFRLLSAGVFTPPPGTETLADVDATIDQLHPSDGFVAVEMFAGNPVAWITGPGRLHRPGGVILPAGSLIEVSGPAHMGLECLDALQVSISGVHVDRVALAVADRSWRWIGRVRSATSQYLPGVNMHLRCDIAHQLSAEDTRRASLLVAKVRFGVSPSAELFAGSTPDLPYVHGSPFSEPFGNGIEGAWMTDRVEFWSDILPEHTEMVIEGDAAVSRDAVAAAELWVGDHRLANRFDCHPDGSWRIVCDLAPLRASVPALSAGPQSVASRIEMPNHGGSLSLMVSRIVVR